MALLEFLGLAVLLCAIIVLAALLLARLMIRRSPALRRAAAGGAPMADPATATEPHAAGQVAPAPAIDADALVEANRRAVAEAIEQAMDGREAELHRTVDTVLNLASDQLGHHVSAGTQSFEAQNAVLEQRLNSMSGDLNRVTELVGTLQRERAKQHGQLVGSLEEASRQSQALAESTQSLRKTLSNSQARGQWGERLAEDVLRMAGFVENVSYQKQRATDSGTIPDFTFFLNEKLVLHMDVKFPIDNYVRYVEAEGSVDRDAHAARFLKDVRARIKEITNRGYIDPPRTVDHVLLFIPNEAVYGFVMEQDPTLGDYALSNRVVLCSPFTLFAVLGVIRQSVDAFRIERTSDEILQVLSGFTAEWTKFGQSVDTLGKRLESAGKAFDEMSGARRRQLQRKLDQVEDLRIQRDIASMVPDPEELAPAPPPSAAPAHSSPPAPRDADIRAIGESGRIRDLADRLTG